MTTKDRIAKTATQLGYSIEQDLSGFIARDARGDVRLGAHFDGTRFAGGYTVDRMGHVMSHDTVRDLIRFAA